MPIERLCTSKHFMTRIAIAPVGKGAPPHTPPPEPPPMPSPPQPTKRTRGRRVPTPPRRLVLPANPLTDPTPASGQERRTPSENNLPPLPMRPPAIFNQEQEPVVRQPRRRRMRTRRQRMIFFGILIAGL